VVRADDDSWNIEESVGATALGAAGSRADETARDDQLFTDPYAHLFLQAASERGWERPYSAELSDKVSETNRGLADWMRALTNWAACRTKFIDDFFVAAATSGIRQVVILAAGLDARAWRLQWPAGTVLIEIDQPGVLEFKADTLRLHGFESTARYVAAAIDLRLDWPGLLCQKGFDPSVPTAWSAEGLLPYLPGVAQDLLFDRIRTLSAPGSRVAVDVYTEEFYENFAATSENIRTGGYGKDSLDLSPMIFVEQRSDVVDEFSSHGWTVSITSALERMAAVGRSPDDGVDTTAMAGSFVEARLPF